MLRAQRLEKLYLYLRQKKTRKTTLVKDCASYDCFSLIPDSANAKAEYKHATAELRPLKQKCLEPEECCGMYIN